MTTIEDNQRDDRATGCRRRSAVMTRRRLRRSRGGCGIGVSVLSSLTLSLCFHRRLGLFRGDGEVIDHGEREHLLLGGLATLAARP